MSEVAPHRKAAKAAVIKGNATKPNDTGSPEVQIAVLTHRINELTDHFKTAQKGQPLASWPPQNGQSAPSVARLCEAQGRSALPGYHREAGYSPLSACA